MHEIVKEAQRTNPAMQEKIGKYHQIQITPEKARTNEETKYLRHHKIENDYLKFT